MTPYTKPLPEQKENTKHGEQLFPLQKYITKLYPEDTTVTAHWHEEAEFTKITKGACRYQIHLETYDVERVILSLFLPRYCTPLLMTGCLKWNQIHMCST